MLQHYSMLFLILDYVDYRWYQLFFLQQASQPIAVY